MPVDSPAIRAGSPAHGMENLVQTVNPAMPVDGLTVQADNLAYEVDDIASTTHPATPADSSAVHADGPASEMELKTSVGCLRIWGEYDLWKLKEVFGNPKKDYFV